MNMSLTKPLALCLATLTAGAAPSQLRAQMNNCGEYATIVQRLAERWGETRQSMGLAANNAMIEVFASAETGTWTITATMPGGPTCLVASGDAFQALAETLPNMDSPA